MIEQHAIVTQHLGSQVQLEVVRKTACGLCGQKSGCGNATWGKLLGHSSHRLILNNTVNAELGDTVILGIDERAVLTSTLCLYGMPLVGLCVGTLLANHWFGNQFYVMLGALLGLTLGFLWVKRSLNSQYFNPPNPSAQRNSSKSNQKYQAVILRLASEEGNEKDCAHARPINVVNIDTRRGE